MSAYQIGDVIEFTKDDLSLAGQRATLVYIDADDLHGFMLDDGRNWYWLPTIPTPFVKVSSGESVSITHQQVKWSCRHKRIESDNECPVCRAMGRPRVST